MNNAQTLTKKQLAIIDELFAGELNEQDICKKHAVSKTQYRKWLTDVTFQSEFKRRLDWLNLQSSALLARYSSLAAAKLVGLIDSDKEETRRKACLDILSLIEQPQTQKTPAQDTTEQTILPPETASKLLEILANS